VIPRSRPAWVTRSVRTDNTDEGDLGPEPRCAFCNTDIPVDHEVFGFGAKARPEIDIEQYRGTGIEVTVHSLSRRVVAIVTGRDSPAARAGHDLYFTACSESCAKTVKAALEEDLKGGGPSFEIARRLTRR
jgi:hypothetical protein